MADTESRKKKKGETGMHRSDGKPTFARFIHWPLVFEAGEIWAENNAPTPEYPEGKYPDLPDGRPNYMGGIAWMELVESLHRHLGKWLMGTALDADSGKSHLAHAFCCLNMLAWMVDRRQDLDDRPIPKLIFDGGALPRAVMEACEVAFRAPTPNTPKADPVHQRAIDSGAFALGTAAPEQPTQIGYELNGRVYKVNVCHCGSGLLEFDAGMMAGQIRCSECGCVVIRSDIFEAIDAWNSPSETVKAAHRICGSKKDS